MSSSARAAIAFAVTFVTACAPRPDAMAVPFGEREAAALLASGGGEAVVAARDYRVAETVRFPAGTPVRIEPGTRFFIAPRVSLIFQGVVKAKGTPERPIEFLALRPGRAWGTVALDGAATRGSVFSNVVVAGGSTVCGEKACASEPEFIGALSGRGTNVAIRSAYLDSNRLDGVNFSRSTVLIADTVFRKNGNDAIDLNASAGRIRGNLILDSGEDGVDLDGFHGSVERNRIAGSGHTGLEIGQRSVALVRANTIVRSAWEGVGIQDESHAVLLRNRVVANARGIRFWIKDGGVYGWSGRVPGFESNAVYRNGVNVETDPTARIGATP